MMLPGLSREPSMAIHSDRAILPNLRSRISNGPVIIGCPWGTVELKGPRS